MSSKDRVNYFPCRALSILPEVRWDCVSRLSSGRTLGGDRSNSDRESLKSKVGLTVAVIVIDRVPGMSRRRAPQLICHHSPLAPPATRCETRTTATHNTKRTVLSTLRKLWWMFYQCHEVLEQYQSGNFLFVILAARASNRGNDPQQQKRASSLQVAKEASAVFEGRCGLLEAAILLFA